MNWKDIESDVGKFAPIVGTLIGGPAGAAVGGLVAAALGTAGSPDAVQAAIATDPQAALKLAQFQSDNSVKLQQMAFAHADNVLAAQTAVAQSDVQDRASARERETKLGGYTTPMLAWLIIGGSLALTAAVVTGYVTKDPTLATLVGTALGSVWSEAKQVLSYYFGSSAGSANKDATIQAQAKAAALP